MSAAPGQPMYQPMPGVAYGLDYAGFWMRFLAKLIDGLIIGVVIGIPLGFFLIPRLTSGSPAQLQSVLTHFMTAPFQLVEAAVGLLFNGFFLGRFGATPGKMALGLKVVTPEGLPISYGRAFGRSAAEIISRLICFIGYLLAAFDAQKRTLHDHMATTRVIRASL